MYEPPCPCPCHIPNGSFGCFCKCRITTYNARDLGETLRQMRDAHTIKEPRATEIAIDDLYTRLYRLEKILGSIKPQDVPPPSESFVATIQAINEVPGIPTFIVKTLNDKYKACLSFRKYEEDVGMTKGDLQNIRNVIDKLLEGSE